MHSVETEDARHKNMLAEGLRRVDSLSKNIHMLRIPEPVKLQVIEPPGRYGDGPVYLRVPRSARATWRMHGMCLSIVEHNPRLAADPDYDYLQAQNTHSAFAYRIWLREVGVPDDQLSVVRIAG